MTSKWMTTWSLSSMISVIIFAALQLVTRVEGVCKIAVPMVVFWRCSSFVSFQNYQIAQIHFCFQNSKISSDNGYPNWIFIILYLMGFVLIAIHILIDKS